MTPPIIPSWLADSTIYAQLTRIRSYFFRGTPAGGVLLGGGSASVPTVFTDNPTIFTHTIVRLNPSGAMPIGVQAMAAEVYTDAACAQAITEIEGGVLYAEHDGSANVTNVVGAFIGATNASSGGTVAQLVGLEVDASHLSGTTTKATALLVDDVSGAADNIAIQTGLGRVQLGDVVELRGAATARTGSIVGLGGTTQTTVGAAGGASALPATPLGYLIAFKGSTKIAIPYYNG